MIFSYKYLKKLANLKDSITYSDVINAINSIGFEVESFEKLNFVKGIKYGKIIKMYKNPNADNLTVCEVLFNDKIRLIQTAATNTKLNKFVIAFIPGSELNGTEIKIKELKSIASEGMMASFDELGFKSKNLSKNFYYKIIILDEANLDSDPIEELDLVDYLIDVSILTNRSDAISYQIMAQEIAAYFHTNILSKNLDLNILDAKKINSNIKGIFVKVNNLNLSLYEKNLLLKSDFILTGTYKDFENLVLIQTGMPIQIIKINSLENLNLVNETAKIQFLNKTLNLNNNLILKKENEIVSFPYLDVEKDFIYENNKKFFIFLNILNPKEVRKNIKLLKANNDLVRQASKNISFGTMENALNYLASKLNSLSLTLINIDLNFQNQVIEIKEEFINLIAGFEISKTKKFQKVLKSLEILNFQYINNKFIIPKYRHDLTGKYDIIEELFRFYGYNNFPVQQPNTKSTFIEKKYDFKMILAAKNYQEVRTYSLVSNDFNKFNPFSFSEDIKLKTYPSLERSVIKNSQALSILEIANFNIKRKMEKINFFDIGIINNGYKSLIFASNEKTFNEMKKDLFSLFSYKFNLKRTDNEHFQNNTSAYIYYKNEIIGWIGKINPMIAYSDLIFVEILMNKFKSPKNYFKAYDSNPLKFRDITFNIKIEGTIKHYIDLIKKHLSVFEIRIIDKYEKNNTLNITLRIFLAAKDIELLDNLAKKNNWN